MQKLNNYFILKKHLIYLLIFGFFYSCQNQKSKKVVELSFKLKFEQLVSQLPEYKIHKAEVDSKKYYGDYVDINTTIFEKSNLPEDTLGDIAVAVVIKNVYPIKIPVLLVKYDRDLNRIVEVRELVEKTKGLPNISR